MITCRLSVVMGLLLVGGGIARAQEMYLDFDDPTALASFPDQAANTFCSGPYSQAAGIAGSGWNPMAILKTTVFTEYHLTYETPTNCFANGYMARYQNGQCLPLDYENEPRHLIGHGPNEVFEVTINDGSRTHQIDLKTVTVVSGAVNIKGYLPSGGYWNWFLPTPGTWTILGPHKFLTKITLEGYNGTFPTFDDIVMSSSFSTHMFQGTESRGCMTCGDWAYGQYKGDCEVVRELSGISSSPSTGKVHSLRCKNGYLWWPSLSVSVPFSTTSNQRSNTYGDWDPGYYKGECADNEMVVGVSQTTDGKLGTLRCSMQKNNPTAATSCVTHNVNVSTGSDLDKTDWDYGFYKTQCADQAVIKGISRHTSTGALHKILCCTYPSMVFSQN